MNILKRIIIDIEIVNIKISSFIIIELKRIIINVEIIYIKIVSSATQSCPSTELS